MTQPQIILRLFALLSLLLSFLASGHAVVRTIKLNGREIGIDEKNGGIVSLRYPGVGEILATEPDAAGLLDLAFPLASYVPMRLQ